MCCKPSVSLEVPGFESMYAQPAARLNRSAAPAASGAANALHRRCACGKHTIGGATCDACRHKQRSGARGVAARDHNKGETRCINGELKTQVFEEHKIGNCVQVHEDAHASDPVLIEACRLSAKCNARGDGGIPAEQLDPSYPQDMIGNLCVSTYNQWHEDHKSTTELRAYTAEAACLRETIDASCGAGQSRAGKIGGAIGATLLGIGGAVGGAFGGAALGQHVSKDSNVGTGLGVAGGVLGAGAGAGLGWLIGKAIGGAAAGKQGSEEGCAMIKGELPKCDDAIKEFGATAYVAPVPFEQDGRIKRDLVKGVLRPEAARSGEKSPQASAPAGGQGLVATAGRAACRFGDLASVPARSSPAAPRIYRHRWGGAP